jgi:inorganic triphosphatase YgiF
MTGRPERELKFIADCDTFKTAVALPLLGEASDSAARAVKSVYFDTEGLDLMRRRIALRMRRMEGRCIVGVKKGLHSDQSHFERNEVEAPSPTPELDLSLLDKETAGELRSVIGEKALAPQFGSDIRRTLKTVRLHGAEIEVAFDSGFLFAGERREPTYEIELELKSGEPVALFELGLSLIDALPLKLGVLSKAERGALLISGEPPEPVRALSLALKRDMPTEEAIGTLFRSCLNQFLDNLPALERGDSVEAVHQMRVAIRRLRSAYGLVCRLCPSVEFDTLRDESKRIGTALGEARDWDVFVESIRNGSLPSIVDAPGRDKFVKAAQSRANVAHEAVTKLANERAAARLALSIERFVAQRGWRGGAQNDRLARLSEPVARFAVESLDRLQRKLLQRGKGFDRLTPPERHAVRIAVKHVRYATDFFGALFHPASGAQRYAERAAALQDLLGKRNDATVALRLIKMLNFGADPEIAYAAGLAAGWVARGGLGDEPALRKAWRSLRKAEPYWRDEVRNGEAG